jgi:hypothetical protein
MDFKIDFTPLIQGFVDGIKKLVESWVSALPNMIIDWIAEQVMKFWNGIWSSGFNLLATPFGLTIDFPPTVILSSQFGKIAYSITLLALALLALRIMWANLSGQGGMLGDAVNGVLFGMFLAGSATLIVGQAYVLVGIASDAWGRFDYRPSFEPHTLLSIGPSLVLGIFTLLVLIFYGWKLMVRAAYRVMLLAFLTPIAPAAGALWAIPQLRWVSVLYWVTWGGWLAGGFLAIGAVSLAVQLALFSEENGLWRLVGTVALMQLAYDLMGMLPKGAIGGIQVGSPFSSMIRAAGGFAMGAVAGGAAAGAAASGASGGGGAVGALPSGSPGGYGY